MTSSAARRPGKRAAHGSAGGGSYREGRPQGPGSPSEGREGEPGRQAGPVPVCGLLREQGPRADGPASDRQGAMSRPRGPRIPSRPSATTRRAHGCSSASNVLTCEQRAQGWALPAASLLSGLRHRGRPPSLEPPALGPPFRLSSCGSELVGLAKASAALVAAAGRCPGAAFAYDSRGFLFTQPPALPLNPRSSEPLHSPPNLSSALSGRGASGCRSPQWPLDGGRDLPGRRASVPGLGAAFHRSSSASSGLRTKGTPISSPHLSHTSLSERTLNKTTSCSTGDTPGSILSPP